MDPSTQLAQAYQQYLGRAATPGEIASRVGLLGKSSLSSQIADIANSQEARNRATSAETSRNQSLVDFANTQRAESRALLDRQNKEQEGLFSNYENIRKSQEALPALYERLKNESGIPQLSEQAQIFKNEIYKTKDTIDRLAEDVLARTTGTLTTESQRRRLQSAEEEPLQTNLGRLGTGLAPIADMLSAAQQGLGTQLELGMQQQDRELEPIKLRINAISDKFARELTGFTADRELQLTSLVDKITRERELSDKEWALAQQLAQEEREFARQKSLAASTMTLPTQTTTPTQTAPTTTYRALPSLPATPTVSQRQDSAFATALQNAPKTTPKPYVNPIMNPFPKIGL